MNIRIHFPNGTTADLPPDTRAVGYANRTSVLVSDTFEGVVIRYDLPGNAIETSTHRPQPLRAWMGNRCRVEVGTEWRPCVVEGWEAYAGRLEALVDVRHGAGAGPLVQRRDGPAVRSARRRVQGAEGGVGRRRGWEVSDLSPDAVEAFGLSFERAGARAGIVAQPRRGWWSAR